MEGEGQPEDSELSEPGVAAAFSEEEGPQASGEQPAAALARSTDLEPAPVMNTWQVHPRGGPVQPRRVLAMLFQYEENL